MLIVVKDCELTEKKKQETYKYVGLFKVMNKISKLIQDAEELEEYITYGDTEYIRKELVKKMNYLLDSIDIDYAKKEKELDTSIGQGGDVTRLLLKE